MSALFFFRFCGHATKSSGICKYERVVGYMKNQFLESFSEKMFQQRTQLSFDTFCALIRVVGSNVERENTNVRGNNPMKVKVALALARLGSGNSL